MSSFQATRHDAGRLRAVSSSSREESILKVVGDKPESGTIVVAHQIAGVIRPCVECKTKIVYTSSVFIKNKF
ncbi:hypothetical protein TNCV_414541 [Trichonephila clavipes]|nr:hypothetical protein TNCV_414541 [Trichonephila clavipes]